MRPPTCIVCKKITASTPATKHSLFPEKNAGFRWVTCKPCRNKSSISGFFSPFSYEDPIIRGLIHDLKYKRVRGAIPILAELVYTAALYYGVHFPQNAVIIPIPLHKKRERFRGFNQSALIACHFADSASLDFLPNALQKNKKTKPQVGLFGGERKINISGAFEVKNAEAVREKPVILFDDVKTTGATLEEGASVLKKTGAGRIYAITIAH